jgi:hypothetical protein
MPGHQIPIAILSLNLPGLTCDPFFTLKYLPRKVSRYLADNFNYKYCNLVGSWYLLVGSWYCNLGGSCSLVVLVGSWYCNLVCSWYCNLVGSWFY